MKTTHLAAIAVLSLIPFASNAQYLPLSAGASYPLTGTLLTNVYNANQIALNNNGNNYGFISNPSPNKWSLGYGPTPSTLATSALTWNDSGNVGIGTTSPSVKLDVVGTANFATATGGYTLSAGGSGGDYGSVGYNQQYGVTTSEYTYTVTDYASFLKFNSGGFDFLTAPSGTAGTTITYANAMRIAQNGKVGIGTTSPDEKLTVNGTIHSTEIKVDIYVPAPDYVFEPTYKLSSLAEIKTFVDKNHHLPEIPSAAEMAKNGLDLGDMNMKLLKKVEELTLYLIEKDKKQQEQQAEIAVQKAILKKIELKLAALENKPK